MAWNDLSRECKSRKWKDLSGEEKTERRQAVEKKTRELHVLLDNRLTEQDRTNADRFLEANEFGLAFEQLIFAVREQERPITNKQFSEIESAYRFFKSALVDVNDSMIADIKSLVRK